MKTFNKTLLVAALTLSGSAFAATNGTLGADSTGTSDVIIIKENVVLISDVEDLDLGTLNVATANISAADDVCVFNSTANYSVTVSSANTVFELQSAGGDAIPYAVTWEDDSSGASPVTAGALLGGQVGDRTSLNCNGTPNATFEVTVLSTDFNAAAPGSYTDTLTLLIEPE